ncbi:C40 family peptidase [Actinophytocola sp.]|uniref:C40 family peptidase n=1 Tax=Actinophytocola sp. TaxID=1872138 RepID=UPI002D7F2AE9|nr:C40 family peptidase [Actinophytocola sp.]HET9138752.1 C40 family peptidase [Actinophytocola sp.]
MAGVGGRSRWAVPVAAAALITSVLAPGPALAHQPTTVAGLLGRYYDLSAEAEKVNEQLLKVQEQLGRKRAAAASATAAAEKAKTEADSARTRAATAQADRERVTALLSGQQDVPGLSALMSGTNRDDVLSQVEAGMLAGQVSDRVAVYGGTAIAEADRAAADATRASDAARASEAEVATGAAKVEQHKAELEKQISEVRAALDRLTPDQRALLTSNEFSGADVQIPAGDIGAVLRFALSQIGKPYLWGAVGPAAYDCSGLMQTSYRVGGIALPRVSIDQSGVGQQVLRHDVRPGDLIFYYQPVHHVAMAVDNLRALHAPSFGQTVKLASIDAIGPITVIRRVMR